jgi:hypothetical protein
MKQRPRKFNKSIVSVQTIGGGSILVPIWHSSEPPKVFAEAEKQIAQDLDKNNITKKTIDKERKEY